MKTYSYRFVCRDRAMVLAGGVDIRNASDDCSLYDYSRSRCRPTLSHCERPKYIEDRERDTAINHQQDKICHHHATNDETTNRQPWDASIISGKATRVCVLPDLQFRCLWRLIGCLDDGVCIYRHALGWLILRCQTVMQQVHQR